MSKASKYRQAQHMCRIFRVLSDETRVKLVLTLRKGERHVSDLCKRLALPQPTVSHHLGLLRIHGLLKPRRQGKLVFYSIDRAALGKALAAVKAVLG